MPRPSTASGWRSSNSPSIGSRPTTRPAPSCCRRSAPSSPTFSSLERRQALADEALAIARSTGDDAITVRVLNHLSFALSMPHLLDQSLAWSAEALEIAERLGDPVQLFWAAHLRAGAALRAGDIDETDRCYEIAWSVAERLDEPTLLWLRATMRALRAQLAGDNDAAEALTTEAFRIATDSGQPDAAGFLAVQQGAVANQRGIDAGDITPMLENLARQFPHQEPAITASIAVNHVDMGRLDDAHRLLRAFAASGFALPPDPGSWSVTMVLVRVRRRGVPRRRDRHGHVRPAQPVRRPAPHERHPGVRPHQPRAR